MARFLKKGKDWRIGWNPTKSLYKGLVGSDSWAIELTEDELNDFCRLFSQLAETMNDMATELMDQEKITCEMESDLIWLEAEGYAYEYSLHLIVQTNRCSEGIWPPCAVKELIEAIQNFRNF